MIEGRSYSTALSLLGPPSGSSWSSYTRIGSSPCLRPPSKKSMPSSAGVFGAEAAVASSYFGIARDTFELGLDMVGIDSRGDIQVYEGGMVGEMYGSVKKGLYTCRIEYCCLVKPATTWKTSFE